MIEDLGTQGVTEPVQYPGEKRLPLFWGQSGKIGFSKGIEIEPTDITGCIAGPGLKSVHISF